MKRIAGHAAEYRKEFLSLTAYSMPDFVRVDILGRGNKTTGESVKFVKLKPITAALNLPPGASVGDVVGKINAIRETLDILSDGEAVKLLAQGIDDVKHGRVHDHKDVCKDLSVLETLDAVHEAGGKAWDEVDDPDKAIAEMRGNDVAEAIERFREFARRVDEAWSFDAQQQHTHTWHDKQDVFDDFPEIKDHPHAC